MAKKAEKLRTGIPLWSKQVEFLNLVKGGCHSPIGFVSGRNCGKSHVGCVVCCLTAKAGDRILIVSPDTNVIAETTWPIFEQVARMTGQWIRGVRSPIYRAFIRTSDGGQATVVFRGAEKPDKLRGGNYALIWFDECSVITVESYKTAIGCGRWKGKMAPVLMTFTPRGRKHWTFNTFYDMVPDEQLFKLPNAADFEEGFILPDGPFEHDDRIYNTHAETNIQGRWYNCKDRAALVRAKTKDNPFAPEQYATFLQSQYTSEFAIQELEGLFIDVAGLMFRREWFTKFVDKAPRHARRIRYWDLAATEEGGCFTVGTLMARNLDGIFYIEDVKKGQWGALERNQIILTTAQMDARAYNDEVEIYVEQEPGSGGLEQSQQITRMLAGFPVYRDLPTGGSSWRMVDGHKVAGPAKIIKARPLSAQSEAGNVTIVRGSWNTTFLDELCLSAGTLVSTMKGEVPIESVSVGDFVLTRRGWKCVIQSKKTQESAETVTVNLSNGKSFRATSNHPIYVLGKGWLPVCLAKESDVLLSSTEALTSIAIQTQNQNQSKDTTLHTLKGSLSNFTTSCGNARKDQFQTDITFTTQTGIHTITPSKTLNVSLLQNTSKNTSEEDNCTDLERPNKEHASIVESSICQHKEVTRFFAAENAAFNTSGSIKKQPSIKEFAHIAGKSGPERTHDKNIAAFHVLDLLEPQDDLEENTKTVSGVQSRSSLKTINSDFVQNTVLSLISIAKGKTEPVYNLEVEDAHEFFAEGVLVHNCSFPHSTYIDSVDSACSCFNKLCSRDTGAPGDIMLLNSGAPEQAFGDIWRRGLQLSELARSNN